MKKKNVPCTTVQEYYQFKNILVNTYLTYQNGYSYTKLCTQIKFDNIPTGTYDSLQRPGCQEGRAGVFICASHLLSTSRIWIFCSGICPSTSQLSLSTYNPGESWSGMIIPSLISRIQLLTGFSKYSLRYGSKSKVGPWVAHACVMKKGKWKALHESEDWNSNLMIKVSLPLVIC